MASDLIMPGSFWAAELAVLTPLDKQEQGWLGDLFVNAGESRALHELAA